MVVKRLEITVPTNAPFNRECRPKLPYWEEPEVKLKPYEHGRWVEEVVMTLMNKDPEEIMPDARGFRHQEAIDFTEEYHRYPARDGVEYSRIKTAFKEIDVNNNGRLSKQEFVQLLDNLNRSKDEENHADHSHRNITRLFGLHTHSKNAASGSSVVPVNASLAPIEEEADASADQVDLGLSPVKPGEKQEDILADMWEHIVKQGLGPGESVDDAEMTFEQFRKWWPRDDTTIFVVTTHHAEALVRRLQHKGIGTLECQGTIITQTDIDNSLPDPPDLVEQMRRKRLDSHNKEGMFTQFFRHCRIHGHSMAHYVLGTGGHNRSTVKEIYTSVHAGAERSFNFTVNLIAAGVIAGVGIAGNSSVSTVASMLISPMMGPILAIAFGSAIMKRNLPTKNCAGKMLLLTGIQNTFITIVEVWMIGFIQGFIYAPWAREFFWPTPEMTGRGDPINLLAGVLVATASGFVVGVAITGGGVNALVGVAISASLLPPIVNCGICCAFALVGPLWYDCLGARISSGNDLVTRLLPRVVDGKTFLLPQEVDSACTVSECGAWSLDDLIACDAGTDSAPNNSCACRYGADMIDPQSPWIHSNAVGTPVTFDSAAYVRNGFISLALFFLNFGIIYVVCLIVFHYKRIVADRASHLLADEGLHKPNADPHAFRANEVTDFVQSFCDQSRHLNKAPQEGS